MTTIPGWIKALLIVLAIVLAIGILWLGAMLQMHFMMMGSLDAIGAAMAVALLVLILLVALLLVIWLRGVSNKK